MDNNIYKLDEQTLTVSLYIIISNVMLILQPLRPPVEGDTSLPYDISNLRNYSLAVSGDVFRWIIDYAPADILRRVSQSSVVAAPLDLLIYERC
jgi:cation-transporting P-type ATPase 13A2